ncbi:tryptophan halogenase [Catenovulum agarivorans DS-2]|uniref:Tryptophan halogenase n=1 Tax=Catenovulum agarivorans DS-2 TaxID=1328313 RepID=W7Q651_9ALTE|nr:tryptophan halogenase family protein [Catenovulum agarivorans]EWH08249.1 tryptophan halogenase [Catenovulum agarivorans DS-2]
MQNNQIESYVILGGGTAGWISAAVLAQALKNSKVNITLIESPNVATVGVGEATIPSIVDLLEYLRIPQKDFILKTNATFKLGIKFVDWLEKGQHYWHQFGYIGNNIDGLPFYQHWARHISQGGQFGLTDFSPAVALAKQNKFFIPDPKRPNNLSGSTYALHFDAGLVAEYLKEYCLKKHNLEVVYDHLVDTELDIQGQIKTLHLQSGKHISADFFIDCSGQRALLINKALRVGYQNWQHYLPANKAIAVQTDISNPLPPYTEATAHEHGWRWRIPLQNRTGNGYVYCDDFCSDNHAEALLIDHATKHNCVINQSKLISFTTGKRDKMWFKNCLAVGLSSGFLEPLESTSIYLIMRAMLNFVQSLPDKMPHPATIKEFNRRMDIEYQCIRDFIVLHYCRTQRTDSAFWRMWQTLAIPDSLQQKLALFEAQGRLMHNPQDLFAQDSWYAVLEGMGVRAKSLDPRVYQSNFTMVEKAFADSANALVQVASKTLDHAEYIQRLKL